MRYLGCRPKEILWVYRLLDLAAAGRPGLGPVHLLWESAGELGVAWDSTDEGWPRPGVPFPQDACWTLPALQICGYSCCMEGVSGWPSFGL